MPPFAEPLDAFFSAGPLSFAEPVQLGTTPPRTIQAIFDDPHDDTKVGEVVFETHAPQLTAKESDLQGLERGMSVTVRGRLYSCIETRPDGTGIATVILAIEE